MLRTPARVKLRKRFWMVRIGRDMRSTALNIVDTLKLATAHPFNDLISAGASPS